MAPLYRNSMIKMIRDKFGGEMKHKKTGNVFLFDPIHLAKAGKIYGKSEGIQTELVEYGDDSNEDKNANGDAGDALLEEAPDSNSLVKNEINQINSPNNEHEKSGPLRKSESPQSPESPQALETANTKVKCPNCDYETVPFFMKIHQCANVPQELHCSICRRNHKPRFKTNDKDEFKNHMLTKHRREIKINKN